MSSKKDKSKNLEKYFMSIAMNLAKDRVGLTGLNPSVGCLIVKDNEIISFGQTGYKGRPHAEDVAIKKCSKSELKGATIFVTMEPCTHYGKTPPCANLIIKSRIKKVVYSINDIDKRTANKAYSYFKSKKIKVIKGLLKSDAKKIYKKYFIQKKINMPYVVAKIASSKDYFITSSKKIITNHHSRAVSHLLRFYSDSILTTSKTANSDNSKLSCRINGLENCSPRRLIVDKNLKINKKLAIINDRNKKNTIIFHSSSNKKKINFLKSNGIKLQFIDLDIDKNINLKKMLSKIYNFGIGSIIVEGGKMLTNSLLKEKLINEFYLFKSDKRLGKQGSNNIFYIEKKLNKFFKKKENIETFLDGNEIKRYY